MTIDVDLHPIHNSIYLSNGRGYGHGDGKGASNGQGHGWGQAAEMVLATIITRLVRCQHLKIITVMVMEQVKHINYEYNNRRKKHI